MFPMVYHRTTQTSDIRFCSSTDGICWQAVPGGPVICPGETGEWDSEFLSVGKDLVPFGRDSVGLLYHGTPFPHKYPRWPGVLEAGRQAWATWPTGRLAGVVAREEGEFRTFPVRPAGRGLRLNARTRRAGEVRVGLMGVPGRDVGQCDPVWGDSLSAAVHWKGDADIGIAGSQQVVLHFSLRSAELFGFEWT